jgi:hypothetical protein
LDYQYHEEARSRRKCFDICHKADNSLSTRNHLTENVVVRHSPCIDLPTIDTNTDVPAMMESESSIVEYSLDGCESPYQEVNGSKDPNYYHEFQYCSNDTRSRNNFYNTENKCMSHKFDQKYATYNVRSGRAETSHVMKGKKDDTKTTCHGNRKQHKMIEVVPGQYMQLRGAQETWKVIQYDEYIPCECVSCDLTLFCIQDATYVLCPTCQVISPLGKLDEYDGGVGLGFI